MLPFVSSKPQDRGFNCLVPKEMHVHTPFLVKNLDPTVISFWSLMQPLPHSSLALSAQIQERQVRMCLLYFQHHGDLHDIYEWLNEKQLHRILAVGSRCVHSFGLELLLARISSRERFARCLIDADVLTGDDKVWPLNSFEGTQTLKHGIEKGHCCQMPNSWLVLKNYLLNKHGGAFKKVFSFLFQHKTQV